MDDKCIMENLLQTTKGACDLFMHGSIESSTPSVHQAFTTALNNSLFIQSRIYGQMERNGWYTSQQAPRQQVDQLKQKYSNSMNG